MSGRLFMVPCSLDETTNPEHFSPRLKNTVAECKFFIVERVKTTRRFIRALDKEKNIDECTFFELDKHDALNGIDAAIAPLMQGQDMCMISEAGAPGVADPGALIAIKAHEKGIQVIPISGPSSIYMALMASGLPGQQFTFHGYLPIERKERIQRIKQMESRSRNGYSQLFMETPYRNQKLWEDILEFCHQDTLLCIATMINTPQEMIRTMPIQKWKGQQPDLHKKPSIFILGRSPV